MFDSFAYAALLYDFYGSLLTGKQKRIIEMHYMDDMSLSEIGEELGISRQAAGILINRAKEKLVRYEEKLGLIQKHTEGKNRAAETVLALRQIRGSVGEDEKTKIDIIINNILEEYPRGF